MSIRLACVVTLTSFCLTAAAGAADVNGARIIDADKEPRNWLSHGRTYSEQRFSPLKQINTEQRRAARPRLVADLEPHRARPRSDADRRRRRDVHHAPGATSTRSTRRPASSCGNTIRKVPGARGHAAAATSSTAASRCGTARSSSAPIDGRLIALDAKTGSTVWETLTVDPAQRLHDHRRAARREGQGHHRQRRRRIRRARLRHRLRRRDRQAGVALLHGAGQSEGRLRDARPSR